jgi:hypothetical protein
MSELCIVFEFAREELPATLTTAQAAWGSPADEAERATSLRHLAHEQALVEELRTNPTQWRRFWLYLLRGWLTIPENRDVYALLKDQPHGLDLENVAAGLPAEARAYFLEMGKLHERFPGALLFWLFEVRLRRIVVADETGPLLNSDEPPGRKGRRRPPAQRTGEAYPLRLTLHFHQLAPPPSAAMQFTFYGPAQDEQEMQRRADELPHEQALYKVVYTRPELRQQLWVREAVYFLDSLAGRLMEEMFGKYWPTVDLLPALAMLPLAARQYFQEQEMLDPNSDGTLAESSAHLHLHRVVLADEQGELQAGSVA